MPKSSTSCRLFSNWYSSVKWNIYSVPFLLSIAVWSQVFQEGLLDFEAQYGIYRNNHLLFCS